jgi:gliding motility-associated-like protein
VDSQSDLILNAPSVVVVINGAPATITLSGNFNVGDIADIIWNPAEFINPTSNPLVWETTASSATNYTVTVITQDGCEATVTLLVDVQDFIRIYFPNAFSPNNVDGINDSFYPQLPEGSIPLIKRMTIFDRWGNHLFERADFPPNEPSFGWDGTYRGKNMKPGVYVYAVEVLLPSGELRIYKGDVTIF